MKWGVWCVRSGASAFGSAATWLKEGGKEWTTTSETRAKTKARQNNEHAQETFRAAGRSQCPLTYSAAPFNAADDGRDARREIYENLRKERDES